MKFLSRDPDFFDMFTEVGKNLVRASEIVLDLFGSFENLAQKVKSISDLEHENDLLTHEIIRKLHKTYLTPIDREDILTLSSTMDDVLDLMWAACERVQLFKLTQPTKESLSLARALNEEVEMVCKTLSYLKKKKYSYVQELCIQIHGVENKCDSIFHEALATMFEEEKDPVMVIKWKEIYENLETASDRCEDVANVFESIILKYA